MAYMIAEPLKRFSNIKVFGDSVYDYYNVCHSCRLQYPKEVNYCEECRNALRRNAKKKTNVDQRVKYKRI